MSSYSGRTNAALAVALRRQYNNPLDISAVFRCIDDFEAYVVANTSYTNENYETAENEALQKMLPYAYDGQIVAVLDEESSTATAYIINKAGALESNEVVTDRYKIVGISDEIQESILLQANAYTDTKFSEVPSALITSVDTSQLAIEDGKLSITSVSTDLLTQGERSIELNGGTATEVID